MNPDRNLRTFLAALAVLVISLALAACGSDNDDEGGSQDVTTTVTTVEGDAAAGGSVAETETAGNTANPEVSQETASSDAASAIPGEQAAVAETDAAQAETATTTTTTDAGAVSEQTETPATGATTTTDSATGQPLSTTTTTTAIDPATGQPAEATSTAPEAIDPATGQPLSTTTTTPATPGTTTTGVRPLIPASPVLAGTGTEAILSRPFNSASPWNTAIAGNAVDRRSDRWIKLSEVRVATVEVGDGQAAARDILGDGAVTSDGEVINDGVANLDDSRRQRRRIDEGLTVNVTRWTVPVFSDRQADAVERVAVCRQFNCGPDAVTAVTVPLDACPDPRYDGWMTVIDNTSRTALDFWRGRCEADGSLSYHYVKRWDLDGPGFQEPLEVSARGSGLPLFAGLITPEEIRDGQIDHALAISVPGAAQRRYVQPASRTDGTGVKSSIPEGARIRLRQGAIDRLSKSPFIRNRMQRSTANTIIDALQRYGAIVVDRSAAPTLYAQKNADWTGTLPLNLLQDVDLEQFEVVEAGPILLDPPAAGEQTAAVLPAGTPGSIPGTASGSQGETSGSQGFSSPDPEVAP